MFRVKWFMVLLESVKCLCSGSMKKVVSFSQDINSEINIQHLQTCHVACPIKKKSTFINAENADTLTAFPCFLSTSIHFIHYNITDFREPGQLSTIWET